MASGLYRLWKKEVMQEAHQLATDAIWCMLLDSNHTFTASAASTVADVSANEVSGTGYTAGGSTLAGLTIAASSNAKAYWDANDRTWVSSTITARHCVLYNADNGNKLICSFDFGSDKSSSGGNFTIQWSVSGIVSLN